MNAPEESNNSDKIAIIVSVIVSTVILSILVSGFIYYRRRGKTDRIVPAPSGVINEFESDGVVEEKIKGLKEWVLNKEEHNISLFL